MIRVSIIIPTFNRLERLKRVLDTLEQQTFPLDQVEVIVISDGSTDGTNEYLTAVQKPFTIEPAYQANSGVAAARNHGIRRAKGQLVLFLDDDVIPAPNLIAEHVHSHTGSSNLVVLGPMLTPPDFNMMPWVRWEQAMLVKQYDAMSAGQWNPTPRQFYTGNASLARHHLVAAGGFDERFRRAEDVELAYRLAQDGLSFVFKPQAIGYHYAERSFRSWLEIPYAYGRNDVIFWRDKEQKWLLPQITRELKRRNAMTRFLVKTLTGRRARTKAVVALLTVAAQAITRVGIERSVRNLYSGIFNLRYYQGVADELGGRDHFLSQVLNA